MTEQFINLQTDLLRTYVTVIDLGNFTETGNALGRSQPAISLQIKRLEELAGTKLIAIKGRQIELNAEGQLLLGYAREILRLNDRAVANLQQKKFSGALRIGLPVDYSITYFQHIIAKFAVDNPDVELDIRCDRSKDLLTNLHTDKLDMVLAVTNSMPKPYVALHWSERPIWVCHDDFEIDGDKPIKLIAHPEGCHYRQRMIDALSLKGRDWQMHFESPGISALQNAVLDEMGVTALTTITILPGLRKLSPKDGFPDLANIHVGLFYKHIKMSDAALKLIEQISNGVSAFRKPKSARG